VGAIAVVSALALFMFLGRYGFFGDKLYFVSAGRRLAFGYARSGAAGARDRAADGSDRTGFAGGAADSGRIDRIAVPLVALSVVMVVFSLPWQPESKIDPVNSQTQAGLNIALYGKFGWRELRDATADVPPTGA
jgi:hypothetical protein